MTEALPIVRSAALEGYESLVRDLGLNAPSLLREMGIHPYCLRDPDTPLAADAVGRLLESGARLSGQSDFGLRLASRRGFDCLGLVSLVLRGEQTVSEALDCLIRYLRLLNPSLRLSVVPDGEYVRLQEMLRGEGSSTWPQAIELAVGVMHGILRELLGPHWRPVSVHFRHRGAVDF